MNCEYSAKEKRTMKREQTIASGIALLAAIGIVLVLAAVVFWLTGYLH